MRNRGNGKGGGIAAAGIFPDYKTHYALHIGFLDESVRGALEAEFIAPHFDVARAERVPDVGDFRAAGLEIQPPTVWRYFVRVRRDCLDRFVTEQRFAHADAAEDEFVYQNSFRLNSRYYAGLAQPQAFVLSHGRDLMILKGVGYAEDIARYYCLEDVKANVWIGHQRYPTRGRVWHPGGAHPFAGLHEALVHNGDFANYHAVTEYLKQRGIVPLFVTDTEVSVLLFDLYSRVLGYPLEHVIEALGPTPEGDFERLSKRRQRIYRALQNAHMHGSPDGPWFFIIARADPESGAPQLIGITDVSMLRPQVFSLQSGKESFGAIASEKQAIDAFFEELSALRPDVPACADHYWNARGGSCTDGGAFVYSVRSENGATVLDVQDKFGHRLFADHRDHGLRLASAPLARTAVPSACGGATGGESREADSCGGGLAAEVDGSGILRGLLRSGDFSGFEREAVELARRSGTDGWKTALAVLTRLRDQRWDCGEVRPARVFTSIDRAIVSLLDALPEAAPGVRKAGCQAAQTGRLSAPDDPAWTLVVDARGFPPEGPQALSRFVVEAYSGGWRKFVLYRTHGDRFIGCGLGPKTEGVVIDVYGSSGDYLGSGMDGATVLVHGNAQDQVGQILKSGRIVVFGDVGQTFLYGAKGGEAYVMGNAAGRPLINAVGRIRAVINGTCLDYCAESFMAGDLIDGGFVIINGLRFDDRGAIIGLETKYPGNNLFSLASGGACYLNDPYQTVSEHQLNGAVFVPFSQDDWRVILPYLKRNEELFGLSIRNDLLVVDGVLKWPKEVFRKVVASAQTKRLDWSSLPA